MIANIKSRVEQAAGTLQLQRREAKYIVPEDIIPDLREFIRPFTLPDPNGVGEIPEYTVGTIQLDSPDLQLHYAKAEERINRFKLRIRTYGEEPLGAPVFLEIKRKFAYTVVKSRATIKWEDWSPNLLCGRRFDLDFKSEKEKEAFFGFLRLTDQIQALPKVIIRYDRESYFGKSEKYARVTIDRRIRYRPCNDFNLFPEGGAWWPVDTLGNLKRNFPGVILELKTFNEVPVWMVDCVKKFNLIQTGFCKYSAAMDLESAFTGTKPFTDAENSAWY